MLGALRRLERALVSERAELAVDAAVDELLMRWTNDRPEGTSLSEAVEFVRGLIFEGFLLPTGPIASNYLEKCRREGSTPDPDRLKRILLPWRNQR